MHTITKIMTDSDLYIREGRESTAWGQAVIALNRAQAAVIGWRDLFDSAPGEAVGNNWKSYERACDLRDASRIAVLAAWPREYAARCMYSHSGGLN